MPHSDYSKRILPYGAGSTRGMSQRHYEAIADTLRNIYEQEIPHQPYDTQMQRQTVHAVINALASRFAAGNDRFDRTTFINAATNFARINADKESGQ